MNIKTITTVREYDEQGHVIKETVTEVERTTADPFPAELDSGRWWQPQHPGWWQYPVISCGTVTSGPGPVLINGAN